MPGVELALGLVAVVLAAVVFAPSHREAPGQRLTAGRETNEEHLNGRNEV